MIQSIIRLPRLLRITYICYKHDVFRISRSRLFIPIKLASIVTCSSANRGEKLRKACEELGPIFVKFGQLLSTRRDILPADITDELAKLQDNVTPFCSDTAKAKVAKSLNRPLSEVFQQFSAKPLACASIAQVHAATLVTGQRVVVKVLRPNIKQQVTKDLHLLQLLAKLINLLFPRTRYLRPLETIAEIKKSIFDELDLRKEAANASYIKQQFANSTILYIPKVYWQFTSHNVLVLEQVHGISVSKIEVLQKHNINLELLAKRGVEIFFTAIFQHRFFHADMHPGNLWVDITNPTNPQYLLLDFGIVGSLAAKDQYYLAANFLAFLKRDYRQVANLHIKSGWIPQSTNITEFEAAIRCVCEPLFDRPLHEISFAQTLLHLLQTARRFNMVIQPQLLLLQKTLISIEGIARQLHPNLDLWQTAQPFLEQWLKQRNSVKTLWRNLHQLPHWLDQLSNLPKLALYHQPPTQKSSNNFIWGLLLGVAATIATLHLLPY